jgi:hypothetical protein
MRIDQTIKSYRKNSSEEGRARSETGVRIEEENNAVLASSGWVVVVVVIVTDTIESSPPICFSQNYAPITLV